MSMETLRRMQEYNQKHEAELDEVCKNRAKVRKSITPDAKQQADALYGRVRTAVKRRYQKGKHTFKATIELKLYPNDVVALVVERFKSLGWHAKHVYNDGEPMFDHLELVPSLDEFLNRL